MGRNGGKGLFYSGRRTQTKRWQRDAPAPSGGQLSPQSKKIFRASAAGVEKEILPVQELHEREVRLGPARRRKKGAESAAISGNGSRKAAGFGLGRGHGRNGVEHGRDSGGGKGERGKSATHGNQLCDFGVGKASGQGADGKEKKKGGGCSHYRRTRKEMAKST